MAAASKRRNGQRRQGLKSEGVVDMFASTIFNYQLPDSEDLNARLLALAVAWRGQDREGVGSSNVNGWHSPRTLFSLDDPAVIEFAAHVRFGLISFVRRFLPDFDPTKRKSMTEAWINVNGPGGFNVPHTHDEFQVSGAYYVSIPEPSSELSGAIEFLNPASAVPGIDELGRAMRPAKFRVSPKAGQMLIFPATLSHWVMPNQEDEDRVSIAFNLRVMD